MSKNPTLMHNANRKTNVFERETIVVDETTGEILRTETTTLSKTTSEPDYIKLYYKTMMAFTGIENIPVSFVMSLSKFLEWSNDGSPMYFANTKRARSIMCEDCKVKEAQINRYIKSAKEAGLLLPTKFRGAYEVNPWMIAKGRWESVKRLRTEYSYTDGTWKRTIEREEE